VQRLRLSALLVVVVLAGVLAACGSSGSGEPVGATVAQPPPTSTAKAATAPPTTTLPATTTIGTTTVPATTTTIGTTTTVPTTTSTQASGGAPAACPGAVGGFIRDVHASGTDCGHARDVANAWFAAVHGGAAPDSPVPAGGYSCTGAMTGERAAVTCSGGSGGAAVSFTASP
jgi:hypothetical protein